MNQIRILTERPIDPRPLARIAVVCTKCGKEIRRGDCGTPHKPGSAQMQYRRMYTR